MRIDSGTIGMDSARLYRSSKTIRKTSETNVSGMSTGSQLTPFADLFTGLSKESESGETKESTGNEKLTEPSLQEPGEESDVIQKAYDYLGSRTKIYTPQYRSDASTQFQKMHQMFLQNLLKMLFSRSSQGNGCNEGDVPANVSMPSPPQEVTTVSTTTTYTEEYEFTAFTATGQIKTDDGRSIDVNINLNMSSRFTSYYSESISTISYKLMDPLVINMDDVPAKLDDITYYFDLDCDGKLEKMSGLSSSSGFLALDKNGDGIINDGSELFGTKSGDGFYDLSEYDEDGNGWIDENDAVFSMLKIWTKDENGNDLLFSLKDKDVGAIFLGSSETDFTLRSSGEESGINGMIRKTGIFLYESGTVGTIQDLDVAIEA